MLPVLILTFVTLALTAPTAIIQNRDTSNDIFTAEPNDDTGVNIEDKDNKYAATFGASAQEPSTPQQKTDSFTTPLNTAPTDLFNSQPNTNPSTSPDSPNDINSLQLTPKYQLLPRGEPGFSCNQQFGDCQWCDASKICWNQAWSCPNKRPDPNTWNEAINCKMCTVGSSCGDWYHPDDQNNPLYLFHFHTGMGESAY